MPDTVKQFLDKHLFSTVLTIILTVLTIMFGREVNRADKFESQIITNTGEIRAQKEVNSHLLKTLERIETKLDKWDEIMVNSLSGRKTSH